MKIDFDKEIDALLRQDARRQTITISEISAPHIDADELAALAENAVPPVARMSYISHLVECDPCRKVLSSVIELNAEAVAASAVSPIAEVVPVAVPVVPWYQKLFGIQGLAYGMGALVLLFAGFIGISLLNNAGSETASSFSNTNNTEAYEDSSAEVAGTQGTREPFENDAAPMANSSVAKNAATAQERSAAPAANVSGPAYSNTTGPIPADGLDTARAATSSPPPPAPLVPSAPTARPAREDSPIAEAAPSTIDEQVKAKAAEPVISQTQRGAGTVSSDRQAAPSGEAKRDMRNERGRDQVLMSERSAAVVNSRSVGGKNFTRREGVWYDSAYSGEATTNVRRGTDAYRRLDSGLRNIAEALSGTVVVVWRDKAYRIQ
ncbi:hypothetical protein [Leptolyngbya sp. 7M]|uniref:hypothetical protein n=1 Tax=Leptolyngbya sp. 7M TaxID=2812896 RepID=UPI001B8B1AA7|nr:hypothetical protein [Leptolyngbya sp. 7M]QYO67374.1 hypothetical protein JVX88_11585 [Leptolyngbya sp. 7M]